MGIYDRDYWKDRQNKSDGYVEKSPLRKSLAQSQDNPYFLATPKPKKGVSMLLVAMLTCFVCLVFYIVCKVFFKL